MDVVPYRRFAKVQGLGPGLHRPMLPEVQQTDQQSPHHLGRFLRSTPGLALAVWRLGLLLSRRLGQFLDPLPEFPKSSRTQANQPFTLVWALLEQMQNSIKVGVIHGFISIPFSLECHILTYS